MAGKQKNNRFADVCRNGHVRTEANTYHRGGGHRQCMDCPGFKRKQLSTQQRRLLDAGQRTLDTPAPNGTLPPRTRAHKQPRGVPPTSYHRVLLPEELAYLRRQIPCTGCGAPFGAPHDGACQVPYNREGDDPADQDTRAA